MFHSSYSIKVQFHPDLTPIRPRKCWVAWKPALHPCSSQAAKFQQANKLTPAQVGDDGGVPHIQRQVDGWQARLQHRNSNFEIVVRLGRSMIIASSIWSK